MKFSNLIVDGIRVNSIDLDAVPTPTIDLEIPAPSVDVKEDSFYYLTKVDRVVTYLVHEGFLPEGEVRSRIRPI